TRRVELALDEVAHVLARRGLALRAVPEEQAAAREGDVLTSFRILVAALPREHERRPRDAVDDDRRHRLTAAHDVVEPEGLELRLRVAGEVFVDRLLLHLVARDDDHSA